MKTLQESIMDDEDEIESKIHLKKAIEAIEKLCSSESYRVQQIMIDTNTLHQDILHWMNKLGCIDFKVCIGSGIRYMNIYTIELWTDQASRNKYKQSGNLADIPVYITLSELRGDKVGVSFCISNDPAISVFRDTMITILKALDYRENLDPRGSDIKIFTKSIKNTK